MSDCLSALLRMWLEENGSDSESVLGIEDPEEAEEDHVEINVDRDGEEDADCSQRLVEINQSNDEPVNDNAMDTESVLGAEDLEEAEEDVDRDDEEDADNNQRLVEIN